MIDVIKLHGIQTLEERRATLDQKFLTKIEFEEYGLDITDYLQVQKQHNTRGGSVNPHFRSEAYKNFFFHCMRTSLKLKHYKN